LVPLVFLIGRNVDSTVCSGRRVLYSCYIDFQLEYLNLNFHSSVHEPQIRLFLGGDPGGCNEKLHDWMVLTEAYEDRIVQCDLLSSSDCRLVLHWGSNDSSEVVELSAVDLTVQFFDSSRQSSGLSQR
jgi:hypothetical protein